MQLAILGTYGFGTIIFIFWMREKEAGEVHHTPKFPQLGGLTLKPDSLSLAPWFSLSHSPPAGRLYNDPSSSEAEIETLRS